MNSNGPLTELSLRINRSSCITRLAIFLTLYASSPATPASRLLAQESAPAKLNITILEGEGAINNIKSRVAREPIVEVTDENHKPVGGALLSFATPNSGPGGTFANGSRVLTVTTDQNGRATARGLRPNHRSGRYVIRVTATAGALTASTTITQTNAGAGGLFGLGTPATIGIIAAVAAITIFALVKAFGGGGNAARVTLGQPTLP